MLNQPKLRIQGDTAILTFSDVTSGRVAAAVKAHIAKSGKPQNQSGMNKLGQGFLATFEQKLYYKLGK